MCIADAGSALTEPEGSVGGTIRPCCAAIRARVAERGLARSAQGMSPPFVVKVVSPDILHKSDAGGVRLGYRSRCRLRSRSGYGVIPAIA